MKTGKATDFEGAELIRHSLVYAGFKILVRLPDWNREGLKIPLLLDMALLFVCLNRACLDFVQEGLAGGKNNDVRGLDEVVPYQSQGATVTGKGVYSPVLCVCPFDSWHTMHLDTYLLTSLLSRGQNSLQPTNAIVLSLPK